VDGEPFSHADYVGGRWYRWGGANVDDGDRAVSGPGIDAAAHAETKTLAVRQSLMADDGELIEALNDLVHDIAKYMVLEVRFLAPDASDEALREAVFTDLCRTRTVRGADGTVNAESAWVLWRRMLPTELAQDPLAQSIDAAMSQLADLPWGDPVYDWRAVSEAAKQISSDIRRLFEGVRNTNGGSFHGNHSGH